jgi:hypothetical protein
MGDYRQDLERLGRRVEPDTDAFERLDGRRRRRERNRRVAAGGLALLVAVGGSLAAYAALRDDGDRLPGIADGTSPTDLPTAVLLTCDGQTTTLDTPQVRPQADGIHIVITNTSGIDLALEIRDRAGENATPGRREVVWPGEPGTFELRCVDPADAAAAALPEGGYVEVEVLDPEGIYVPTELACDEVSGWYADFAPDAVGVADPVAGARDAHEWIRPDDVVELAGYPESETKLVRVVRDGEIVAVLESFRSGPDEWLETSGNACAGITG